MVKQNRSLSFLLLMPVWGTILFLGCYLLAAIYYPGGSQAGRHHTGFDWSHNYWCNLLAEKAINGAENPGRPFAIASMLVMGITLSSFWFLFAHYSGIKKNLRRLIQVSGTLSMLTLLFLSPQFHDSIINLASSFGLVAMGGIFSGLSQLGWKKLLWMGIINVVLIGLNNLFYYNDHLIRYLPLVQKITFLYFLTWVCLVNVKLYQRNIHMKAQQETNQQAEALLSKRL